MGLNLNKKSNIKKEDSKKYNKNQKNEDQIWPRNKMMPNVEGWN
jgi:hypothetical protein